MIEKVATPLYYPNPRIEEFMRGSIVQYKEESPLRGKFCAWYRDIVWGTSTDSDGRDIVEIGKHGCNGYLPLESISGIELTEDVLLDYGFLQVNKQQSLATYYRDDIGYLKLSVYGVENLFSGGKPCRYIHQFQRVFFDFTHKILNPKISEPPVIEKKASFQLFELKSGEQMLKEIADLENKYCAGGGIKFELDDEIALPESILQEQRIAETIKNQNEKSSDIKIEFDFD